MVAEMVIMKITTTSMVMMIMIMTVVVVTYSRRKKYPNVFPAMFVTTDRSTRETLRRRNVTLTTII